MKMKNICYILFTVSILFACNDDPVLIIDPINSLSNDCIKRSLPIAPNIAGNEIEFAYAMALPQAAGVLTSAQVVASIAGAEGTYFDPNSYYTNNSGQDIPVLVANESQTSGTTTSTEFLVDTCAATLRYYYMIPQEAKGKEVEFVFSVNASNGQKAEYKMGPYQISRMDMTLSQNLDAEHCYLSFHDPNVALKIYTKAEIEANPSLLSEVDIMYGYSELGDLSHAFYTKSSPADYMDGISLPEGFVNDTKMLEVYGLRDRQLANLQYSNFIDDLDFEKLDMGRSISYALGLKGESGVWLETSDGAFRAFVYVNEVESGMMTVSVKRYPMK